LTTVEESYGVPPLKRALDDGTYEKLRAAEDEPPHGSTIPNQSQACRRRQVLAAEGKGFSNAHSVQRVRSYRQWTCAIERPGQA
jgi:hypothetical protein